MEKTLVIHGRQPALGIAELEGLFGPDSMRPVSNIATVMTAAPADINFNRLGGMVKFCKILTVLDTADWADIEKFLLKTAPGHANNLEEGKLTLGLSVYGLDVGLKRLLATSLELKKAIRKSGRPVRIVPNKKPGLNSAQVLHNGLTRKMGWELIFLRDGNKTIVAQSIAVQDIEKYAARDQKRPYRDAKVGMLPPKLAQTLINLAVGKNRGGLKVCDPFCGTGVILQEALLMGHSAMGSDIDPRMVDYSKKNLEWLLEQDEKICPGGVKPGTDYSLEVSDASKARLEKADAIASEIFLGKPLSSLPDPKILAQISNESDQILQEFLKNAAKQTNSGFRMCLAVPAWKSKKSFKHLATLDKLSDLGYNRLSFVHVSNYDLIYYRPDQIVARELLVLERK